MLKEFAAAAFVFAAAASPAWATRTVDVADHGALPDDGKDDTVAIVAALKEAAATRGGRLVFSKGVYNIEAGKNPANPSTLFPVNGADGLTIDGRGAEIMVKGPTTLFAFAACRNVTIQGLTVDWERSPFSVGRVIASTKRSFTVDVAPEFPVQGGEPVGAFMDYDPETRLPARHGLDVYNGVDRTESVGPQVLKVHLKWDIEVPVGRLVVLRHHVYGYNVVLFHKCSDVVAKDMTIYTVPGMALVAIQSRDVTLERFRVLIRPGTGRLMSATADGSHFGGCMGTVTLKDCVFEGMGDDGANIKSGLYLTVLKRIDDRTILGQHNLKMVDMPDPGDVMETIHTDTLLAYGSAKVSRVTLEQPDNVHRVEFESPLPAELREGDVLGNATRAPRLRISGCTFRANRARGVLCQTRDAVIERCRFENCTSAGIMVLTEVVYFFESIGTRDVTVRRNQFINCNYGAASGEAALQAFAWLKGFAYPPKPGVHRNVVFEDNTISGTDESAIFAAGVEGLTIRRNTVELACRSALRETGHDAIRVMSSSGVVIEGNKINPAAQGAGYRKDIRVDEAK